MIAGPGTEVSATRSSRWEVAASPPLGERTRTDIETALELFSHRATNGAAAVLVESIPPQHVGLGTKTALILAALVAAQIELSMGLDAATLQSLSGRGGTSGVGIHGFFTGGFIVDAGHPQTEITSFSPSSSRRPKNLPMLILRLPVPVSWRFHLVLPRATIREGSTEAEFFTDNTPIPEAHVHEAISVTYHGLVPAVRNGDLTKLRRALAKVHAIGFKARELAAQAPEVRDVYDRLFKTCAAPVGMSSMGPLLFVVLDARDDRGARAVAQVCADTKSMYLGAFAGLPDGYSVSP